MKKRLPIIIIAVLVVVFAGLGFYSHQKSKIKYNTSYVNGNTAGNPVSYTHLTLPTN